MIEVDQDKEVADLIMVILNLLTNNLVLSLNANYAKNLVIQYGSFITNVIRNSNLQIWLLKLTSNHIIALLKLLKLILQNLLTQFLLHP